MYVNEAGATLIFLYEVPDAIKTSHPHCNKSVKYDRKLYQCVFVFSVELRGYISGSTRYWQTYCVAYKAHIEKYPGSIPTRISANSLLFL